ncbi:MAG: efflux RND transporter periplasmic adaptor subunit [Candidatus Aminicenantales bacterium]
MKTPRSRLTLIGTIALAALMGGAACSGKKANPPMPGSPVTVASAEQKDVPLEIASVGRAEALATVSVKAQVGGEVTGVYFKEGQNVRKGDRLFTIDPRPFEIAVRQAESLLEKDRAQLKNAEADVTRYADLVQKDYVTKEQYDALIANRDVLVAAVKADEAGISNARLNLDYATVRSPIDGRTGKLLIDAGNIIKANDVGAAVVIDQISPIYVTFSVPEQNLVRIKEFMAKEALKVETVAAGEGQTPASGVLTFVDNAIDETTGTIMLRGTFDNTDLALWPGQFLNVRLTLTTEKGVVVVPSQAVQTGQAGEYVFVVKDDLTAEMRPVKVAREFGGESVIAEGLKPGERVVTDGQLRLGPGAKVEVKAGR